MNRNVYLLNRNVYSLNRNVLCCLLLCKLSAWFIFIAKVTQHVVSFEMFIFNNKQMAPSGLWD